MTAETPAIRDRDQPGRQRPARSYDRGAAASAGRRRGVRWLVAALAVATALAVAIETSEGPSNQLFAPSSVWNTRVPPSAPLDPASATYVSELAQQVARYGPWFNTTVYSVPLYTVGAGQSTVPVGLDPGAGDQPDLARSWREVPLPADARPASGSDGSLVLWQPRTDKMWEFWQLQRGASGWHARWGGYMASVSKNPGFYTGHPVSAPV
jgi:hypothetical protein